MTDRPRFGLVISVLPQADPKVPPAELRAALIEDGRLTRLEVYRADRPSLVGAVYRARIATLSRAQGSAFLDLGHGLSGHLDLPRGADGYGEGDTVTVQVARDAGAGKQMALRRRVELAGIGLALVAAGGDGEPWINLSRLATPEREAAQAQLRPLLEGGEGEHWVAMPEISGLSPEFLTGEIARLRQQAEILALDGTLPRSTPLVQSLETLARPGMDAILVDDPAALAEARRWIEGQGFDIPVETVPRFPDPFECLGLAEEVEAALARVVTLPSGGAVAFDPTPTLTAIDIDRGHATIDDQTLNREALAVIAQQIILRNLGGLILIDALKTPGKGREKRAAALVAVLEQALARDPLPSQILGVTRGGLIEMIRPRTRASLGHLLGDATAEAFRALRAVAAEALARPSGHAMLVAGTEIADALAAQSGVMAWIGRQLGRDMAVRREPALGADTWRIQWEGES